MNDPTLIGILKETSRVTHFGQPFDAARGRWVNLLLMIVWCLAAQASAGEVYSASSSLAGRDTFASPSQFFFDHVLKPSLANPPLARPLNLPRRARVSRSQGPLRQIRFAGGDRISGEILRWRETDIQLRLSGGQVVSIPKASAEALLVPPGEIELLAERFEETDISFPLIDEAAWRQMVFDTEQVASGRRSLRLSSPARPLLVNCPQPLEAARLQFWLRADRRAGQAVDGRIALEFESAARTESLVLEVASTQMTVADRHRLGVAISTQVVPLRAGWQCVTAIVSPNRLLCLVDDLVVASGPASPGPLRAIRFSAGDGLWIDDLLVSRLDEQAFSRGERFPADDDLVATPDGEEFFGRVKGLTPLGVVLDGIAGEQTRPWSRVAAVSFRPADRPVQGSASPRDGLVAHIEWQSLVDRPDQLSDRLTATITRADRDTLTVWHPWLGELLLAWRDVSRIEPQFVGRMLCLDARRVHLGDSIRADFRRPLPDGIEWTAEFDLAAKPQGEVWLSLNVADLEPSGPETPPASPFLPDLHAGRLLTEVTMNDQPAGNLNCWIRFRSTPERPERLRCRVPSEALRAGRNSIRLRQRPLTDNGTDFDDCELSDLRLELVETQ